MANLEQIRSLNIQYNKNSPLTEDYVPLLNEAFDPDRIEKGFNDSVINLNPTYTGYFEFGLPAQVTLIFIDVCSFSTRFSGLDGDAISEFFDEYYKLVIPIIYKHNGEIDKIIGDGIIAVFGPPFSLLTFDENIKMASKCSKAIIAATANTRFESKIALHAGFINYFKNKSGLYNEYTIIGKPLTELFRLETISEDNSINYYQDTDVSAYYDKMIRTTQDTQILTKYIPWQLAKKNIPYLKGVSFKQLCYIKYKPLPLNQ